MFLSPFIRIFSLVWLISNCVTISKAQENTDKAIPQPPQPIISKVEFIVGAGIIYGGGNEFIEDVRVPNIGLYVGIDLCHSFNHHVGLELKVAYEQKGFKSIIYPDNTDLPPPFVTKVFTINTLNYATVTLLPRIFIKENVPLHVGVGPYAGYFLINRIYQETYWDGKLPDKYSWRGRPDQIYKKLDFGITFTAGYEFRTGKKRASTIQFMYSCGIRDIAVQSFVAEHNNNNFTLGVGICLDRRRAL